MRVAAITVTATLLLAGAVAWAQQPVHNPAATQPGKGRLMMRELVTFQHYDADPKGLVRQADDVVLATDMAYGLTGDLVFMLRAEYMVRDQDARGGLHSDDDGFSDLHIMLKKRVWQQDTGPTDTRRLGLAVGLDLPTGSAPFGSDSWDPMLGVIYTEVEGRWGFNAAWRWKFNTGSRPNPLRVGGAGEDLMMTDLSWLYRLSPDQFTAQKTGAWYAILEANGFYETNGDMELFLAPGIMYEAQGWALEASVQLPAFQDLDHRPDTEFAVTVGVRLLF